MREKKIVSKNHRDFSSIKKALETKPDGKDSAHQGINANVLNNIINKNNRPVRPQRKINSKKNRKNRSEFVREPNPNRFKKDPPPPTTPNHELIQTPGWFAQEKPVDVTIIIPMFKSREVIANQIASWSFQESVSYEIIYVDDKCPQKSHEIIIESWERYENPSVHGKIIRNSENAGYGTACNIGAKYARGKYLLFLNADTSVTSNWIEPMVRCFKESDVGIVGNLQLKYDGRIDSAASEWDWKTRSFQHRGRNILNQKPITKPFHVTKAPEELLVKSDVDMVTGCCFLIPKTLFDEIGGFDQQYRIGYWEDSELNMRVKAKGYRIVYQPESRIYHKLSHSRMGFHPYLHDNKNLFIKRWVDSKMLDLLVANTAHPVENTHPKVNKNDIVVYTAITDGYDKLKEKQSSVGVDFVAFLEEPIQSNRWKYRPVSTKYEHPNRNAKVHKILSHVYFPDKKYSLWIDGSVTLNLPVDRLIELYLKDHDLLVFKHPERQCLYDEAKECMDRRLDDRRTIETQIARYRSKKYPEDYGLAECTVILRRHNDKVKEFNERWWTEICNGSKRDQISFNYVAREVGLNFGYFPGSLRERRNPKPPLFSVRHHEKSR